MMNDIFLIYTDDKSNKVQKNLFYFETYNTYSYIKT